MFFTLRLYKAKRNCFAQVSLVGTLIHSRMTCAIATNLGTPEAEKVADTKSGFDSPFSAIR